MTRASLPFACVSDNQFDIKVMLGRCLLPDMAHFFNNFVFHKLRFPLILQGLA